MRASTVCVTAVLLFGGSAAFGGTVTFSGTFPADDYVQFFRFTVQNTGFVTVATTSYATGGFEPILSLFDSTGAFLFLGDGYPTASDAVLPSWNAVAGENYIVTLTEFDNYPRGDLTDGFTRDGQGNFTATLPFNNPTPGASFLLPGGEQRTGNWAVAFSSADPTLTATQVPEPGSSVLLLAGAGLLALWKCARQPA